MTTTPLTTEPAITPLFIDEPPVTGVGGEVDSPLVGDVLGDGMGVGVGDEGVEDCEEAARHDTSAPLVTAKILEDSTPFDA